MVGGFTHGSSGTNWYTHTFLLPIRFLGYATTTPTDTLYCLSRSFDDSRAYPYYCEVERGSISEMALIDYPATHTLSHLCFSAKNDGIIALNTHNNNNYITFWIDGEWVGCLQIFTIHPFFAYTCVITFKLISSSNIPSDETLTVNAVQAQL